MANAKKKKIDPIKGIGRDPDNKLIVQKTRPLFALWQSDLTLSEFKILDTYLARIDTRKPEKRTVQLTKGQLEEALGVTRINRPDLSNRLKHLYTPIDLAPGNDKRVHLVGLFEEAEAEQDDDGVWQINLTCTKAAMKYVFNAEKLGYLRYKLRSITSLTSRYSYILFTYLEANRFRKSWDIPLDELKEVLDCNDASYNEFKIFNQRILKRCQRELTEKTECRFTYETIRRGRSVSAIHFTLETLADSMQPPISGQISLEDLQNDDPSAIYAEALPPEFTPEQIEALRQLAVRKVPYDPFGPLPMECVIADYLAEKVAFMRAARTEVKHPFSYLRTMIEKDPDC